MKKITTSIMVIGVISILAVAATQAFFSDTETSSNNSMTAGALDLKVASASMRNGESVSESSWDFRDLIGTEKFFNFLDVKPGDYGQSIVTMQAENNYWACVTVRNFSQSENDLTEPEVILEDNDTTGELGQNIKFVAWADDGDGIHQATETTLASGNASQILNKTYALADSTTGSVPIAGNVPTSIGFAWCAGTQTVNVDGSIACDGSTMDNSSQTDSMKADISFYATQSRNNAGFTCGSLDVTPTIVEVEVQ